MGKRKKKVINLTLDEKLLAQLTDRCNEIGIDRNGYITKLIEYSLDSKIWEKKQNNKERWEKFKKASFPNNSQSDFCKDKPFVSSVVAPGKSTKSYYLDDIEAMYSDILEEVFSGVADVVSDKDLILIKALTLEERLKTDKAQWTADKLKEIKELLKLRGTYFRKDPLK